MSDLAKAVSSIPLYVARILIEAKAELSGTQLVGACIGNDPEGVRLLCEVGGVSPHAADYEGGYGVPAIHLACMYGATAALEELVAQAATHSSGSGMRQGSIDVSHALWLAPCFGNCSAELVNTLLDLRADVNEQFHLSVRNPVGLLVKVMALKHRFGKQTHFSRISFHANGATPLMQAVMGGQYEAAAALIARGARLDLRNSHGYTVADLAMGRSPPAFLVQAFEGQLAGCLRVASLAVGSTNGENGETEENENAMIEVNLIWHNDTSFTRKRLLNELFLSSDAFVRGSVGVLLAALLTDAEGYREAAQAEAGLAALREEMLRPPASLTVDLQRLLTEEESWRFLLRLAQCHSSGQASNFVLLMMLALASGPQTLLETPGLHELLVHRLTDRQDSQLRGLAAKRLLELYRVELPPGWVKTTGRAAESDLLGRAVASSAMEALMLHEAELQELTAGANEALERHHLATRLATACVLDLLEHLPPEMRSSLARLAPAVARLRVEGRRSSSWQLGAGALAGSAIGAAALCESKTTLGSPVATNREVPRDQDLRIIGLEELRAHNNMDDGLWISYHGHDVYHVHPDVSKFLDRTCLLGRLTAADAKRSYEETIFGNPYEDEPPRDLQQTIAKAPRWANLMGPYLLDSFRTLVLVHCELFGLRKMLLDLVIDSRETLVPFFCI
eukprot:g6792.t3